MRNASYLGERYHVASVVNRLLNIFYKTNDVRDKATGCHYEERTVRLKYLSGNSVRKQHGVKTPLATKETFVNQNCA